MRDIQDVSAKQDENKPRRISSFRKYVDQAVPLSPTSKVPNPRVDVNSKRSTKAIDEEGFLE